MKKKRKQKNIKEEKTKQNDKQKDKTKAKDKEKDARILFQATKKCLPISSFPERN